MVNHDIDKSIICKLISNSIFNSNLQIPEDIDWKAVMDEMSIQTIIGIPYSYLPLIKSIPTDVVSQWMSQSIKQQAIYKYLLSKQTELVELFKANNIPVVILKGTAVGCYYPIPAYRTYGDVDFLVKCKDYDRAFQLMIENGYVLEGEIDNCEHHIGFIKDNLVFELHSKINGIDGKKYEQQVIDLCEKALDNVCFNMCDEINVPVMKPIMNGLTLIFHIVQHLIRGLGMRQIIDWMMFVYNEIDDASWKIEYEPLFKKFKVDKLAMVTTKLAKVYLGMPADGIKGMITWCDEADDILAKDLLDYIMEQGNFGVKQTDTESKSVRSMSDYKGLLGFLHKLQSSGYYKWKFAHKHKWAKPFAWIYQVGHLFKKAKQRGIRNVLVDRKKAKARKKMLIDCGVIIR